MTEQTPGAAESKPHVLVVDDDESIRKGLQRVLSAEGYAVDVAADAETAWRRVVSSLPDLVITDLNLPGRNGMEFIADVQERGIETTLVVLTGHGSIDSAVEATRRGVYDYLVKPIDRERLTTVVRKALERSSLRKEVLHLRREMLRGGRFEEMIGKAPSMVEMYRLIEQVAPSTASVLITGESGTGKELVARTIHRLSPRAAARLVAINCAAIPATLLESEIFGHEKGAFTGATSARAGCFELAHGGTLFLDEIGEMPTDLQTKLLRVLEDGMVRRVGGSTETKVDVRVLAATNVPIETLLTKGTFREDLYYRLNVFTVHLPPLRERPGDVALLAGHFLAEFARENSKALTGFTDEALDLITQHGWPGNARELRNVVQRAAILCSEGEIQARHLPEALRKPRVRVVAQEGNDTSLHITVGTSLDDAERELVMRTLAACEGNKTKTAAVLGISPKTLYAKLRLYGVPASEGNP
ncbi:MAG: sigma-54 dependent transcriptional regulator [bacterium]